MQERLCILDGNSAASAQSGHAYVDQLENGTTSTSTLAARQKNKGHAGPKPYTPTLGSANSFFLMTLFIAEADSEGALASGSAADVDAEPPPAQLLGKQDLYDRADTLTLRRQRCFQARKKPAAGQYYDAWSNFKALLLASPPLVLQFRGASAQPLNYNSEPDREASNPDTKKQQTVRIQAHDRFQISRPYGQIQAVTLIKACVTLGSGSGSGCRGSEDGPLIDVSALPSHLRDPSWLDERIAELRLHACVASSSLGDADANADVSAVTLPPLRDALRGGEVTRARPRPPRQSRALSGQTSVSGNGSNSRLHSISSSSSAAAPPAFAATTTVSARQRDAPAAAVSTVVSTLAPPRFAFSDFPFSEANTADAAANVAVRGSNIGPSSSSLALAPGNTGCADGLQPRAAPLLKAPGTRPKGRKVAAARGSGGGGGGGGDVGENSKRGSEGEDDERTVGFGGVSEAAAASGSSIQRIHWPLPPLVPVEGGGTYHGDVDWLVAHHTADPDLRLPPLRPGRTFAEEYEVVLIIDRREQFSHAKRLPPGPTGSTGSEQRKGEGRGPSVSSVVPVSSSSLPSHRSRLQEAHLASVVTAGQRVRFATLSVGDALWVAAPRAEADQAEGFRNWFVLDFALERKSLADLWASLCDQRYPRQKWILGRGAALRRPMYLFEGGDRELAAFDASTQKALRTAAQSTQLEGFLTLHSSDVKDTIRVLLQLSQTIRNLYGPRTAPPASGPLGPPDLDLHRHQAATEPTSATELETFPGWNTRVQKLKRQKTTQEIWALMLVGSVPGLGEAAALAIAQKYPTAAALCRAYEDAAKAARSSGDDPSVAGRLLLVQALDLKPSQSAAIFHAICGVEAAATGA